MTLKETLKAAELGDVQSMLLLGDYYGSSEKEMSMDNMEQALKWYERAAHLGNIYGLEMAGRLYTIFATLSLQISAFEDALKEWDQAFQNFSPLLQYEGYTIEKQQEIRDAAWECFYKRAYCFVMLDKDHDALFILDRIPIKPVSKEMLLKGICLFRIAEQEEEYETSYQILKNFELQSSLEVLQYVTDAVEETVLSKGYIFLSILYRTGTSGLSRDVDRAHSILCMILEHVKSESAVALIQIELQHYKKKMFDGYQYVK